MSKKLVKTLKYDHLHNRADEIFGDGKYVTEEMLRSFAENDEYELEQIKDLWDSTDPEIRTWQNPIPIDNESYGISNAGENYTFSNDTNFHGSCEFKNFNTIDRNKTTAHIDTENGKCQIPKVKKETINTETNNPGPWGAMNANEYWYISYNRTKTYTPSKYTNTDDTNIPAIIRAQKFKAKTTGQLKTLTLNLKGDKDAEQPLIIEIYEWIEGSDTPKLEKRLAKEEIRFTVSSTALTAINFNSPPQVVKDKEYFFLVKSPLTSYSKAYGIGGWSASCGEDTYPEGEAYLSENNGYSWIKHGKIENKLKYHDGKQAPIDFGFTAHIEETQEEYLTDKEYIVYFKTLRMNPVEHLTLISEYNKPTNTEIEYKISQDGINWENFNTREIRFSEDTEEGHQNLYNNPNSTYIFLKIILKTNDTSKTPSISKLILNAKTIPARKAYLKSNVFTPKTSPMLGASIWSRCYHPYKINNLEGEVKVKIDLFEDKTIRERFKIINLQNIKEYKLTEEFLKEYYTNNKKYTELETLTTEETELISEIKTDLNSDITIKTDKTQIQSEYELNGKLNLTNSEIEAINIKYNTLLKEINTESQAKEFIKKYPLIVNQLRKYNIFLKGTYELPLSKSAIQYLKIISFTKNTGETLSLLEDHNFQVDYDTGEDYNREDIKLYYLKLKLEDTEIIYDIEDTGNTILKFGETETDKHFQLEEGDLEVEYTPALLKGLDMTAFYKYDSAGNEIITSTGENICDGYPLDIMVDEFKPENEEDLEFKLTTYPVCAIRKAIINEGQEDEREIYEDSEYEVDYENKKIKLKTNLFTNTNLNTLTIKYTPNITSTGLGVAYRLKRNNNTSQVYILPNYWQYRV